MNDLLRAMFEDGCITAEAECRRLGQKPLQCRIIGGYGMDPEGKKEHKDLDVMVLVDSIKELIEAVIPTYNAEGIQRGKDGWEMIQKPLDIFVCDAKRCLMPYTITHQSQRLLPTTTQLQESGFIMEYE